MSGYMGFEITVLVLILGLGLLVLVVRRMIDRM